MDVDVDINGNFQTTPHRWQHVKQDGLDMVWDIKSYALVQWVHNSMCKQFVCVGGNVFFSLSIVHNMITTYKMIEN